MNKRVDLGKKVERERARKKKPATEPKGEISLIIRPVFLEFIFYFR